MVMEEIITKLPDFDIFETFPTLQKVSCSREFFAACIVENFRNVYKRYQKFLLKIGITRTTKTIVFPFSPYLSLVFFNWL